MHFIEFSELAKRKDASSNDAAHYFSKYFSTKTAFLFYKLRASPNFVTWVFLITGFSASLCVWNANPILAFILWRCHIIIDMADGALARATKTFSKSADGFDRSCHIIINTSVLLASTQVFNNNIIDLCLLVSFYLTYFFSRNYFLGKAQTQSFSHLNNIFKDFLGLEGYIFFTLIILHFGFIDMQIFLSSIYSLFFLIIYLLKLNSFFHINKITH